MIKEIVATGKDILEAKENARAALGVGELDDVQFEILHAGSKGFMGFFTKPAQVRAYIELPDREERRRDRKKDRPKNNNNNNSSSNTDNNNATEAKETAENGEQPRHQNKNKKKKHRKPDAQQVQKSESKQKSQVIPEAELGMELRVVEVGEDMSFDFINTVISDIGLNATAELYACEDGTRRIAIKGEDAATLIGHHGDTLDALQYLANLASARKNAKGERDKSRVTLDIEGYRAKREETLRALARRMAAKALRNRRSVMLEPMTAYERRIIHSEIQDIEGVSTNSIGSDNNRKIVIYLTDKKPQGIFEEEKVVTPLSEEFKADEDETTALGAIDQSALAYDPDGSDREAETVTVESTVPDEAEDDIVDNFDDSDIK